MTMSDDERLVRPVRQRRSADPTGSSFDLIKTSVHCPHCGRDGLQPLRELVVNDDAECPYCGRTIDIGDADSKRRFAEEAKIHKNINPIR
jgi:endogenous inhibitor of DNA gyrase (YacG/DUF329 family)